MNTIARREELLAALRSGNTEERRGAARDLWRYPGAETTEALLHALEDENDQVRWWSARTLGRHKAASAVGMLVRRAVDPTETPCVRKSCIMSLGEIGDRKATPALVHLLQDSSPDIQEEAASALGDLRDRQAAPALACATYSEHWNVRWSAALSLWLMRIPETRDALLRLRQDEAIPDDLRSEIPDMLAKLPAPRGR